MKYRGYTLIELLVVILIMALLAGFAIPTYQTIIAEEQLSEASNQLVDFLLLTQQQTVTQQQIYGVTFTTGATTVAQYLYNPNTATKTPKTTFSLAPNTQIGTVNFSNQSDVRFSTGAAPNVSGTVVVYDTVRNRHKLITISPSGSISDNQSEY